MLKAPDVHAVVAKTVRVVRKKEICYRIYLGGMGGLTPHRTSDRRYAEPSSERRESRCAELKHGDEPQVRELNWYPAFTVCIAYRMWQ